MDVCVTAVHRFCDACNQVMERGLGIGGNYDSNLRLPWCCLYKTQVMAHQSSVMQASVTRYSPEPEVKQPENKTEEKKEDAQLETPSY